MSENNSQRHFESSSGHITGFLLGLIIALSLFYVAMEWNTGEDFDVDMSRLKHLDKETKEVAAIDQDEKAPDARQKVEERDISQMLNISDRAKTPQPKEAPHPATHQKPKATLVTPNGQVIDMGLSPLLHPEDKLAEVPQIEVKAPPVVILDQTSKKEALHVRSELPEPPGGWVKFIGWLSRNIRYPRAAKALRHEGRVMVTFVVQADGKCTDMRLSQKASPELNAEVMRVLRLMGNWKPGLSNGRPAPAMVDVPVTFIY